MKKLLTLAIATALLAPAYALADDDEVTPLQLKVMQTRKFMKPIKEVAKAAQEDGESLGARCIQIKNTAQNPDDGISGTVTCHFMPNVSNSSQPVNLVYELSAPPKNNETTVRIKISSNWAEPKPVKDPEVYAKRFKSIGDLIFIEAIPLSPAVQN